MGRNTTVNVKENKNYFAEYYHKTNEDHVCECGCKYLLHSKRKHLMSVKHITLMQFKNVQEELNKLKEVSI
jgi:hypothetical protein